VQNNVTNLRSQTAEYMRSHRNEFIPFLVQESTGDLYNDGQFRRQSIKVYNNLK